MKPKHDLSLKRIKKTFGKIRYHLITLKDDIFILFSYGKSKFAELLRGFMTREPKWLQQKLKKRTSNLLPKNNDYFKYKLGLDESSRTIVFDTIICFGVLIFALSQIRHDFSLMNFETSFFSKLNHSDLGQIHAGIGAVIFALIIFIAESLRDEEGKDKAKVLLRESLILPITVFEILTFFLMLFDIYVPTSIQATLVLLVGLALLWSLGQLVYILLNENIFESKRLKMFSEKLSLAVDASVKERVANNILNEKLQGLVTWYPAWKDKKTFVNFHLNKFGVVRDIRLDAPQKIVNTIEAKLNSEGKSLYQEKETLQELQRSKILTFLHPKKYTHVQGRIFWSALYNSEITQENNIVLQVSSELIGGDEDLKNKLNNILTNSIVVGSGTDSIGLIYDEFQTLRQAILVSIKSGNTVNLRRHLKTYLTLVDNFLKALIKYIDFSYEQAKEENKNIESLKPLSVLEEDLADYISEAYKYPDLDVLEQISYLPFAILKRSLEYKDHLTFQRYSGYIIRTFWMSYDIKDLDISKKQRQDISRHISDLIRFYIEPEIRENLEDENTVDFALNILITLQNLLKHTVEKNDLESFKSIQKITFEFLNRSYDPYDIEGQTIKKFQQYRSAFIFALNAWLYKRMKQSESNKPFFDSLKVTLPNNIPNLFDVYTLVNDRKIESFFGWSWWDIPRDGEVYVMNYGQDIEDLFVYLVFKILDENPTIDINTLNVKPVRDISNYAQNNELNPLQRYTGMPFGLGVIGSFEELKEKASQLFLRVKEIQDQADNTTLTVAPVSEVKKKEFYEEVVKNYKQYTTLRNIVNKYGKIKKQLRKNFKSQFGYNQLYPKEYFVENWHIGYMGLGDIGENFARSEDNIFLEKISSQISIKKKIPKKDILTETKNIVSQSKYNNHYLILWLNSYLNLDELSRSDLFTPAWQLRNTESYLDGVPNFNGCLNIEGKQVPVATVYTTNKDTHVNQAMLFSSSALEIKQYLSIKSDLGDVLPVDNNDFYFNLFDLNQDDARRNKITENNPDWLQKEENPEDYLKRKVIFYMLENAEVILKKEDEVTCFLLV